MNRENCQKMSKANQRSSGRSFGLLFSVFFLIISLHPLLHHAPIRLWALIPASIFLFLGVFIPSSLSKASQLWIKFGKLIGDVTNPILMSVIFFVVLTPYALLMKILKKSGLAKNLTSFQMHFNPKASTYWVERDLSSDAHMENQF